MRTLLLNDPTRRPPDWTAHLADGEAALFLADLETGAELLPDGTPPAPGASGVCLVFASLAEAKEFAREVVGRSPHLCGEIYDHRGKAAAPLATVVHPKKAGRLATRQHAWLMVVLAVVLLLASPLLFYLDAKHDWSLILPTFLALNCIFVALRLFSWAHGLLSREQKSPPSRPE